MDLSALEQRLGIALPESYRWVIEEFGTPMSEPYVFYSPDDVSWFADHPRGVQQPAPVTPPPGGCVVIGEEELTGHPLVFLSFPVAGVPVLSDEVYVLRPGEKPEEVALDFAELLESLGIALVQHDLSATAFRVRGVDDLTAHVEALLTGRGYLRAVHGDEEGEHVFVSIFEQSGVVWIRDLDTSWLWFGRLLSMRTRRVCDGWEVVVNPEPQQFGDELKHAVTLRRKVRIDMRGELRDLEPGHVDYGVAGSDAETTARDVLWALVGELDEQPHTVAYYLPPRPALSPRLLALLTAITDAGAADLTEVAGQRAVRIELPDGTRQLSVVSDDELTALREHTDLL